MILDVFPIPLIIPLLVLLLLLLFIPKLTTLTLFCNLPSNRLQLVLNVASHTVTKTPKLHHLSLYRLKINQRIQYKIISLTLKTLHSGHPSSKVLTDHSFALHHSGGKSTFTPSSFCSSPLFFFAYLWLLYQSLNLNGDPSTSVFLKKLKSYLFGFSFPSYSVLTWASFGWISLVLTLLGFFISSSFCISSSSCHSFMQFSVWFYYTSV